MNGPPQQRKRPIPPDWDTIPYDSPAAEFVVKPSTMAPDQECQSFVPRLEDLKDDELYGHIRRKKNLLDTAGRNLPDRGARLRASIRSYEDEFSAVQQKVDEEQMEMLDELL
ncbi:Ulp1 protease family carboxy-terminal domain protein, partial [Trifolium medium]|nr:Ulp1 protease family carboxy-terminal domain protein [Trifolium medium]